ncbi:MAG: DUF6683 family protein [Tabrizicola sp.]
MRDHRIIPSLGATLLMATLGAASAQSYSPDYGLIGAPMSSFINDSYLTQSLVRDLSDAEATDDRLESAQEAAPVPPIRVDTRRPGRAAGMLAAHYPANRRGEAEAVFVELLSRYHQVEQQFGIPVGDLGGALAAFVAGNWMALNDKGFPDALFPPLVDQMRALLSAQPGLAEAPEADLRDMYHQLVIVGMLMASTQMGLQRAPDPATASRMHEAAGEYLRQMFKTDPDLLQLGPNGLDLADRG